MVVVQVQGQKADGLAHVIREKSKLFLPPSFILVRLPLD